MTKRNPYSICRFCKKRFTREFNKQTSCSMDCAFWSRVDKTDSCWNWTASKHVFGYGDFRYRFKYYRAHRLSYEMHYGPIQNGLSINHHCDNPSCVNPEHLYGGTQADNMSDRAIRDRVGTRKLTPDDVRKIKSFIRNGMANNSQLAHLFSVSATAIWSIAHGKTWKHI